MMLTDANIRQFGMWYIHEYPDVILNTPTKFVLDFDKIKPMIETAKLFLGDEAIGIAAPQIGLLSRFFVWKITEGEAKVAINPRITEWSPESHVSTEGCLSFPRAEFKVRRADEVQVSYEDINGDNHIDEFKGLRAELFQHEIDHLDGITLVNNINLVSMNRV